MEPSSVLTGSVSEPGGAAAKRLSPQVTIYDVAEAAGVSPSTVSRVFSRPGRVSARMAEHVRSVAAELGYHSSTTIAPHPRESMLVGLAIADITNPAYFGIIRGAEAAAAEHRHALVLIDNNESGSRERDHISRLLPSLVGVVATSPRMPDQQLRMVAKQVPMVVLNRHSPGVPSIVPDNGRGMRRAAEHLGSLGHRRLVYVAGPEASWTDGIRWRALQEAALQLELTVTRVGPFSPTVRGGRGAAAAVLNSRATAVVAYNDVLAVGIMQSFLHNGIRVPEQISIVGVDNSLAATLVTPALTTVGAPTVQLGSIGVSNVIGLSGGAKWGHEGPLVLPMRLVVRESTGPSPA